MATQLAGISFPFRTEGSGLPAQALGVEVVRSALIVLLKTRKGSRVMRPTLGTNIHLLLFEDVGPALSALIQREIILAVSDWLPQVNILFVDVVEIPNGVEVNVQYEIQGVQDETGFITFNDAA